MYISNIFNGDIALNTRALKDHSRRGNLLGLQFLPLNFLIYWGFFDHRFGVVNYSFIYKVNMSRKELNVLFNDTFNTFYLRLYGVGSCCFGHPSGLSSVFGVSLI